MKISKIFVSALILTISGANIANAKGLSGLTDLFSGGNLGETVTNVIEGVFSSSNITVADMAGDWTADGPAVCFQGESFLQKAGGIAAASAIETKLAPYYEQYGLNNAKLTIDGNGAFTLSLKGIRLTGNITQATDAQQGIFNFNFTLGGMKLASVTTYVQKTSNTMDVMFDAKKLITLVSAIAKYTNISTIQSISGLLESYDGLCIGFKLKGGSNATTATPGNNTGNSNSNLLQNGLDLLKGALKK